MARADGWEDQPRSDSASYRLALGVFEPDTATGEALEHLMSLVGIEAETDADLRARIRYVTGAECTAAGANLDIEAARAGLIRH